MWTERKNVWLGRDLRNQGLDNTDVRRVRQLLPAGAWHLNRENLLAVGMAIHEAFSAGYGAGRAHTAHEAAKRAREPDEVWVPTITMERKR